MSVKRINGYLFEKMLINGLENLKRMEQSINALNVFPVADGDTGTNMRLTLENGLRYARSEELLCNYLHALNDGLLLGARGNSGVILSQLFKGFYQHMARCAAANVGDMRNAFTRGYKVAYQAMMPPVEGTILTVAREGIENIRLHISRGTTMESLFTMYVAEMKKSLAETPKLLPALKAAGVVDSGALGYITIIEGMSKYLNGEILRRTDAPKAAGPQPGVICVDDFNETSSFDQGYCMEFILQLMVSSNYNQNFNLEEFVREMKPFGNSIAATQDRTRVKVHIHTKEPAWLITLSQRYGEFLTFKLENMQLQHNEHIRKQRSKNRKPLGIIAVGNGDGMKQAFKGLGCHMVLDGGPTMNTSSSEFVDAIAQADAANVVILPNNKNVIGAAQQAVEISRHGRVHVIPTHSIAEGYFALAMDVGNEANVEKRIAQMRRGARDVTTVAVALAEKAYQDETVSCVPGDYIALVGDKIVCTGASPVDALIEGLATVDGLEDKETCLVFRGKDAQEDWEDDLADAMEEHYSNLEVSFTQGDQPTYLWVCGII